MNEAHSGVYRFADGVGGSSPSTRAETGYWPERGEVREQPCLRTVQNEIRALPGMQKRCRQFRSKLSI